MRSRSSFGVIKKIKLSMGYRIFSVDGSPLTEAIAIELGRDSEQVDVLGKFKVDKFSDGELSPQFTKTIRDMQVFLISSTTTPERILTLLLTIDAAKRASAKEIILVIPYFGYSRQDRKEGFRGAIGAKLMADLLQAAGADKLISIDLHSEQIQGFFDIPVNMIPGSIAFNKFVKTLEPDEYCVCSPDAGGVKRAMRFYSRFLRKFPDSTFAMMSKIRIRPNEIERMDLIGDVAGKHVLLIDDMVDTGGTLVKAAELLKAGGATKVTAMISHGVLSGKAHQLIGESEHLDQLVITNSIEQPTNPKIHVVNCAPAIALAIEAIVNSYPMDEHFEKA
jgi:ribose-phosphate pyrophosphokinase